MIRFLSAAMLLGAMAAAIVGAAEAAEKKIRLVILDGQNNHNWRATTPYLKEALEQSGRFTVDVASHLKPGDKPGAVESIGFPPDLSRYQVALSNYNGQPWPEEFQRSLVERVQAGELGLVVFHGANNPFASWGEFNRMIGMGWRGAGAGDRLYLSGEGELVPVPKGQGQGAGETSSHPFPVIIRDPDHPVTRGLPREWMHTADQLVHGLRGPAEHVRVLATAYSPKEKRGTGEHELMLWTVEYGRGRVFHTPMGHDLTSLKCAGLTTVLLRGCEWAATGDTTIPIPADFPGPDQTSSR